MSEAPFIIKDKIPPRESFYLRLNPNTLERLNELEKTTGVRRAEIIQQCVDYALERLKL